MQLDRNVNPTGLGKYALVLVRKMLQDTEHTAEIGEALSVLEKYGIIDWGQRGNDFFVIRLKDRNAAPALDAYARSILRHDPQFALQVRSLATTAMRHPDSKQPD
jgi:hypothetical protein